MNPNLITWEVEYKDGTRLRERDGNQYEQIPRGFVTAIDLHSAELGQVVVHLPTQGSPDFFYRRRTQMVQGGPSRILYLLGIYPEVCLALDAASERVTEIPVDIDPVEAEPFYSR